MFGEHLHHPDFDFITGTDRVHNAVVLVEGFDHMIATLLTAKGWSANPNAINTGRFAGKSAQLNGTALQKTLPSSYSTLILGFAINTSVVNPGSNVILAQMIAGATGAVQLILTPAAKLLIQNSGGSTIATSAVTLVAGNWYYIEIKAVIAGASGSVEMHVNGAVDIASTTGNFGSTNLDKILIQSWAGGATILYDDVYVVDTSGSAPRNTFLGDCRVATIMPSSDGAHTDFTPSAAGSHYNKVNEISGTYPDGDTTYVSDSTVGHIDTYGCDDIDSGATVFAVQTNLYARKDDANTRQIAPLIRQAGTDYVGSTVTLGSSYGFFSQIYNQDPTGSDWTAANVNADEFGVKVIA